MKKTIKLNESQLNVLIDNIINEEGHVPSAYVEHWESKFHKSVEILIKLGWRPNDLIDKIKSITNNLPFQRGLDE